MGPMSPGDRNSRRSTLRACVSTSHRSAAGLRARRSRSRSAEGGSGSAARAGPPSGFGTRRRGADKANPPDEWPAGAETAHKSYGPAWGPASAAAQLGAAGGKPIGKPLCAARQRELAQRAEGELAGPNDPERRSAHDRRRRHPASLAFEPHARVVAVRAVVSDDEDLARL